MWGKVSETQVYKATYDYESSGVVPDHGKNADIKKGSENNILKQAGLN